MPNPPTTTKLSPSHLRSLYRSFLRELPLLPTAASSPLHQRLRTTFSEPLHHDDNATSSSSSSEQNVPSPTRSTLPEKVQEGEQYLSYLRAQRTYLTLLERYNPGVAMDAGRSYGADTGDDGAQDEDRERVRATARRVGMTLPSTPSSRDGGGGQGGDV